MTTIIPPVENEKPFGVSNIKSHVPIILDVQEHNYDAWRELFETHCYCYSVHGHLDGTSLPLNEDDEPWKRRDNLVKMWIYGTITDSLRRTILKTKSGARDVWTRLENLFRNNKEARAIQLENELRSITIADLTIDKYCEQLKTISDLLSNVDAPISERVLVMHLINGLNEKYDSIINVIQHAKPFPTFDEARSMLQLEESRLKRKNRHSPSHHDHSSAPTVLLMENQKPAQTGAHNNQRPYNQRGGNQNNRGNRNNRGRRNQPRFSNNAWSNNNSWPNNNFWPQQWMPQWNNSTYPQPRYNINNSYPMTPSILGPRPTNQSVTPQTWNQQNHPTAAIAQAFNTMTFADPSDSNWYMDTGATAHLTNEPGNLRHAFNKSTIPSVTVGNGSLLPITQTDFLSFPTPSRPLSLREVHVCPKIIKNLISVRQFTTDNWCSLSFDPFGFSVKDFPTDKLILRCDSTGPLYPLTKSSQNKQSPSPIHSSFLINSNTWHRRLEHPSKQAQDLLVSKGLISCNKCSSLLCHECQLGKHVRLPFQKSSSIVSVPFEIIHSDIWTSPVLSITDLRYYVVFLDHYSQFIWVYPLKRKSDVFSKFLHFHAYVKTQFNLQIKSFQCDHGGEFDNKQFQDFFGTNGIHMRFSCPQASSQNGKAERVIRTINNMIRTLLIQSHLPTHFWVEALHMAIHLLNLLPSSSISNQIPFTTLFQKPVSYNHLRIFGCLCYPNLLPTSPHKLAPRSTPCVFLGYPSHHRGYRCLDIESRKIIISRHVVFDENVFPFSQQAISNNSSHPLKFLDHETEISPIFRDLLAQPTSTTSPMPSSPLLPSVFIPEPINTEPPPPPPPPPQIQPLPKHQMVTRSKHGIVKPKQQFSLAIDSISPLPKSHNYALNDPHWHVAMQSEFDALIKSGTWDLVPRPLDVNIVRSMWLYRHKFHADGSLARYKARLVANGKSQTPGVDCDETYSPVVKPATIRTVIHLALGRNWPLHQLDVQNAFLHGNLDETIYMHQPPGYVDPDKPKHVCLLRRSLYGLKQAPRAWFRRFSDHASRVGFTNSKCDSSLFIFQQGDQVAYLLLYVDDILLTASSTNLLQRIIKSFADEFAMTDLGPFHHFLGITANRNTQGVLMSQKQYAIDILHRAGMSNCKSCLTPVDTKSKLAAAEGPPVADSTIYRSLAGALQYLTITRSDITYAVQQICLFMHDPREPHFLALKRILRYIQGTLDHGLQIYKSQDMQLTTYSDADWGGCPTTRRSTSGYAIFLGPNLISWSSKRQATISRSSAEAEYRAVANAVAETCWIRNLLLELKSPPSKSTVVYCDNVSAIYMAHNPVNHQRTKHIEIDIHFVREKVALGVVRVLHVPSSHQYADIFTKGLPTILFQDFRSSLNIRKPHDATAGE